MALVLTMVFVKTYVVVFRFGTVVLPDSGSIGVHISDAVFYTILDQQIDVRILESSAFICSIFMFCIILDIEFHDLKHNCRCIFL